jgi:hypothetical protein
MRSVAVLCCFTLILAGFVTLSLLRGQEGSPQPLPATLPPDPAEVNPGGEPGPAPPAKEEPPREPAAFVEGSRISGASGASRPPLADSRPEPSPTAELSPLAQQMHLSAQWGIAWLSRMNGINGRFLPGYLPALQTPVSGDHYLRQAGAAYALARGARFTHDKRHEARAEQTILVLLEDTTVPSGDRTVRYTTLPPGVVNRLGAAGMLVLAINELPHPKKDLLDLSEQLCAYIRKQARPDGSLRCQETGGGEGSTDKQESPDSEADVQRYPGLALAGLMRSQRHRPAAWKTELVSKALPYYQSWWRKHKNPVSILWQTTACTEAFLSTKEPAFAQFVLEMNDWLCDLQYDRLEPQSMLWYGGFKSWQQGRIIASPPDVHGAAYAESLAEAYRVAQVTGDRARGKHYRDSLERSLQFLVTLQYTEANTQHFSDWYRPRLLGAFHASHQDGTLRVDYTTHAVCALTGYLEHVAQRNADR